MFLIKIPAAMKSPTETPKDMFSRMYICDSSQMFVSDNEQSRCESQLVALHYFYDLVADGARRY